MSNWEELRAKYHQNLSLALEALQSARQRLAEDPSDALSSLRRIAHQLRGSGASYGYPSISEAAARLEAAPPPEIDATAQALEETLREVIAGEPAGWKVLLVEDDPSTALLVESILARLPAHVTTATNAEEAMQSARRTLPHLVLLDLVLPDMDGRSLLIELRRLPGAENLPILVASARDAESVRSECLMLGAAGFLAKPLEEKTLLSAIRSALQHSIATTSLERTPLLMDPAAAQSRLRGLLAGQSCSVALLDIDHLGKVYEEHGRRGAEKLFEACARLIGQQLAADQLLARGNRDDFLLLLPGDGEQAEAVVQKCIELVGSVQTRLADGSVLQATLSAGLEHGEQGTDAKELLDKASQHLAQAKRLGRNRLIASNSEQPMRRPRLLIADDDDTILALVRHRLSRAGFDIDVASNGREALERAGQGNYDLIILDVKMPIHDGFEVTRQLRQAEATSSTPIVLFTSMGSERDVVRGFDLGVNDYITKPFSPGEMVARISHILRKQA